MEKNERNKKLIILVGTLLLVIGVSFAYFTGVSDTRGNGNIAEGNITVIKGSELNVQGSLEFNDTGIFPGHKNISSVKVTATGNNELIPYNLIWNGTNNLNTPLNFTVYKTSEKIEVQTTCEKKNKVENGLAYLSEECTISNLDKLGPIISIGTIETSENNTKVILAQEEFVTATNDGTVVYYYIVLEYPNLEENQNIDMGKGFDGIISVEESSVTPDISIMGVYIKEEDGTYKKSSEVPQSGYTINKEKSTCTNNATPEWKDGKLEISGYTKQGTQCELYFDEMTISESTLAKLGLILSEGTPDFSKTSCSDDCGESIVGIYKAADNDGDSYYYRGDVTNNYLKFANKWWRIIRINGDGTIRIIYDGTVYHANGTSTSNSIAVANTAFNSTYTNAIYVGFKYGTTSEGRGLTNKSIILTALKAWYTNNLLGYENRIDMNAGFCGDRTAYIDTNGTTTGTGYGTSTQYFADYVRLITNKAPVLTCENNADLYTVSGASKGNKALEKPIGLMNANEVVMAGGVFNITNQKYYLYNGQNHWTMSPYYFNGAYAYVFILNSNGYLNPYVVRDTYGVRPVINLRADVPITGSGTETDPFVVS